jgi:hypothetical protein
VLDLDTGGGYDLPGATAGSEAAIVLTTPLGAFTKPAGSPGTAVSVLATSAAPAIPACAGR